MARTNVPSFGMTRSAFHCAVLIAVTFFVPPKGVQLLT